MTKVIENEWYTENKKFYPPLPNRPRYGIEIEFEIQKRFSKSTREEDTDKTKTISSKIYSPEVLDEFFERVGADMQIGVDGRNLELRSHPNSKDKIFQLLQKLYAEPLKTIRERQGQDSGIHVHSDARNYLPSALYRNLRFLCSRDEKIRNLLTRVGRRPLTEGYGYIPSFKELEESCRNDLTKMSGRYGIFLNSWHGTHEFRFFKTATDLVDAAACLDFVDALHHFSRFERTWEENAERFTGFVKANNQMFPYLSKVI